MSRIHTVLLMLVVAGFAATATAETIYKWVDGAGQVHYTDLPPRQSDAKVLGIYQQEAGLFDEEGYEGEDEGQEGDEASDNPEDANSETASAPPPEPPVSQEARTAAAADAAKARVEQCKEAQDRYKQYTESQRLYRQLPDGKREYLSDKELAETRARARQTVIDYCGS